MAANGRAAKSTSARARKRAAALKQSALAKSPRKDLVLEHLLNRAAELFLQRGYANTRMQDIAESMQMSRSSLYHYFENKEQVLRALTEGDVLVATDTLEALLKDTSISWVDKLRGWIEGNIREKLAGGARFRLVDRMQDDLPSEYREIFREQRRKVLALVTRVIEGGVQAGEFRAIDPKIIAFAVTGMSNWTAWWYSPNGRSTPDEIARHMTDFAMRGVLKPATDEQARPDIEAALGQLRSATHTLQGLIETTPGMEHARQGKAGERPRR
jgi:AcrR family transcriptional regulator